MNAKTNNSRFPFLDQLDQGFGQLVNDLFPQSSEGAVAGFSVAAGCWELEDRYVLSIDVPGVPLSAIDLQVDNGFLEISGERQTETPEEARVILDEQPVGTFQRRLRLAKDVDVESVDAELDAGVLTVTLKKVAQPKPQKVQIRTRTSVSPAESAGGEAQSEAATDSPE